MTRKTNFISILQFDEHLISRVRARRSSKGLEVVAVDQEQGSWQAHDGSLEAALKAFAATRRLQEDQVFTVLPRYDMTARILELPSNDLAEIDGMVRLSAEEYVPFSHEELITDQCILSKTGDGGSRVLAVFAHRDVVEGHLNVLRAANLEPEQVFLSTACLASAAVEARKDASRYALVHLGSGGLEVLVINKGRLEYGRAVASQQDWDLATGNSEDILEELGVEVRASLSAYRRESEDGEDVEAVYLCSESVDVTAHAESLYHEIGVKCSAATFATGAITEGKDLLRTLPMVALGGALIAMDRAPVAIRLLPKGVLESRERKGVKRNAIRFGALAAAILIALIAAYAQAIYQRKAYIKTLEAQIARVDPVAKSIVSKQRQLRILQHQVDRTGSVVDLLASLVDLFPSTDINITNFIFTHGEKIEVAGRSKTLPAIEKLAHDLTEVGKATIPQFARAQRMYENQGQEKGLPVWDYKISLPFPEAPRPSDSSEDSGSE